MPSADKPLPEGTDSIIEGAGVSEDDDDLYEAEPAAGSAKAGSSGDKPAGGGASADLRGTVTDKISALRGQAGDKARDFAQAGKDRAGSALDDLVRMVEDAASEIDGKIGSQYGDYARRAADGIGGFAESFKDKDVDQLFDEARALVKKSPTVALGIAAALGFVVARIARAGVDEAAAVAGAADKAKA